MCQRDWGRFRFKDGGRLDLVGELRAVRTEHERLARERIARAAFGLDDDRRAFDLDRGYAGQAGGRLPAGRQVAELDACAPRFGQDRGQRLFQALLLGARQLFLAAGNEAAIDPDKTTDAGEVRKLA